MMRVGLAKLAAASVTAGTASAVELAQVVPGHFEVDASQFIAVAMSGAIGLTAVLIASAWKDLKTRLEQLHSENERLRNHLHDLDVFRSRMMWACPLADPSANVERQREHLMKHLDRLDEAK